MPPDAAELVQWLQKAAANRRSAEALTGLDPPITDTAAFHCQQAVEKFLKAYLYHCGADFEKTHDLRALALQCSDLDSGFAAFETKVAALTPYAVRFRYPGPADPTPQSVHAALAVVREVEHFVLSKLPPRPTTL